MAGGAGEEGRKGGEGEGEKGEWEVPMWAMILYLAASLILQVIMDSCAQEDESLQRIENVLVEIRDDLGRMKKAAVEPLPPIRKPDVDVAD